jgi:phenylalanyl-tRNA synthetase beta chain
MTGLEVEGIEPIGQSLEKVLVVKIEAVEKHPQADRLFICHVDTGTDHVPVVCGAPNLDEGSLVPMALPGTTLPNGMVIKESRIRGKQSLGMLLAEDELGLTSDHTGLMILPENLKPGMPLSCAISLEDYVLDISLTPNRPDCASVIGIAREIAALTGQKVRMPVIEFTATGPPIQDLAGVTVDDPLGCPRYAAGMVQGVDLKPSPFWLRYRLHHSGVRAINNVVDITNYVLLEMGQPLHAFDYDRLKENRIVVRRAKEGDTFTTLDGQTHSLNGEHLMICDGQRAVALAGIMGGLNSEIFEGSKNVLIESAYFDPKTIRKGSKTLGLSTEASYRFERGIDMEGVGNALKRAVMLISDLAGGSVNQGIIDEYPKAYEAPIINLRIQKTNEFLGTSLSQKRIASFLKALEMDVRDTDSHTLQVTPPSFRVDLMREVDLMEEVARLEGYDNIPVTIPLIQPSEEGEVPSLRLRDEISEIVIGMGFSEIITYSFISPDSADYLNAPKDSSLRSFVKIQNPLTIDQSVMRTSLIPGLLVTMKENIDHSQTDLRLFEWGRIFITDESGELPHERLFLSGIMTGLYEPKSWNNKERVVDFYDIKGVVEVVLNTLGLRSIAFQKTSMPDPAYHPEVSCTIQSADLQLGRLGQVHPQVLMQFDIHAENAYIFELDIEALLESLQSRSIQFTPFSRFPAVIRDLSLIVDQQVESERISEIIKTNGGNLVESIILFDLYEGENIAPSQKAMSFRICYRSKDSTLDGKKINQLHESIVMKTMKETGGTLKEG